MEQLPQIWTLDSLDWNSKAFFQIAAASSLSYLIMGMTLTNRSSLKCSLLALRSMRREKLSILTNIIGFYLSKLFLFWEHIGRFGQTVIASLHYNLPSCQLLSCLWRGKIWVGEQKVWLCCGTSVCWEKIREISLISETDLRFSQEFYRPKFIFKNIYADKTIGLNFGRIARPHEVIGA